MGQTSSRPTSSKVFNAPDVKIDPSLRSELESSPETDVVLRLYSEKYIEDKVSERLYAEQVAAQDAMKDQSSLIPKLTDERLGGVDTAEMRKKVAELHRELTSRPLRGSLDNEGKAAREKLVQCLVENKDRPLKCRATFADFQKEISRIEKSIASS